MATMKVSSPICAVLYYFYYICALYTYLFGNVCVAEEFLALNNLQTNTDTELFPEDKNGLIVKGVKRELKNASTALELLTTPDYLRVLPKRQFRMKRVHHLETFVNNETIQIQYASSSERPLTKSAPIKSTPNEQKMTAKPKPLADHTLSKSTTTVKPKVSKNDSKQRSHKVKHPTKAVNTTSATKPKHHKTTKMHQVQPKADKINRRTTHAAKHLHGTKHTTHNHKIHSNQPYRRVAPESKHKSKGKLLTHKKVVRSNIQDKIINNFSKRYTNPFDKKVYAPTLADATTISLVKKQKMQEKEHDHETIFARILRYLNKKLARKNYGYTASIRIRRTTIANGCIIDPETVVTVLENFESLPLDQLSIRAGRSGDSQILDVYGIQPHEPTNTSKPIVTTLKVRSIFEFGNTLYAANITKISARNEDLQIVEWRHTKNPEEFTDIPIKLVGYPASHLPVTSCYAEFGQDFNRTTMYCIQRVKHFNKYPCEDHPGSLLVNSKTKDVLAILTRRNPCGDIAVFTKMDEVLKGPSPDKMARLIVNLRIG